MGISTSRGKEGLVQERGSHGQKKKEGFQEGVGVGTSMVVQWLGLQAPNVGGLDPILGQGDGSHMRQLRPSETK